MNSDMKKNKKGTRTGNRRGCIRTHGKKWEASVFIDGKRYYFTADTKAQAEYMINEFLRTIRTTSRNRKNMGETMQSFARSWLSTLGKMASRTQCGHERIVYMHIIPFFGEKLVSTMTTKDVQEFVDTLDLEGKSPKTIKNIVSVLSGMLRYAISKELLQYNPVRDVKLPRVHNVGLTDQFLDVDYYMLLNILKQCKARYRDLFYIALMTGMRRSELLGLTWDDIDFSKHAICINHQLQYDRKKKTYTFTKLKSYNSRVVVFSNAVMDKLKEIKNEQDQKMITGLIRNPLRFVFVDDNGDHIKYATLHRAFRSFIEQYPELPQKARFHDLRGSFATHCFDIGISEKTVSYILGHRSVEFTIDRYMRVSNRAQLKAANQLDRDTVAFDGLNNSEIRSRINSINNQEMIVDENEQVEVR